MRSSSYFGRGGPKKATQTICRVLPAIAGALACLIEAPVCRSQADLATAHVSPTLYFSSATEEATSRAALHARVPSETRNLASALPGGLSAELDRCEALMRSLRRHDAFLRIQTLENTEDQSAKRELQEVRADQSVLEAAIDDRLRQVTPAETALLGQYAFLAQTAQRDAAHALSPDAERYRASITGPVLESLADAYDRVDGGLKRPKDVTADDAHARRLAIAAWNQLYEQAAPEEATLLGSVVELENRDAIAHGYQNAADRKYQLWGLSDALVAKTLSEVQAEAPAYRHYQEVLARHAAQVLKTSPVLSAELDKADSKPPYISLLDAKKLILAGLQPLGPDYTTRFAGLLTPENGRLDLAGGAHRARTGTSIAAYDAPTLLYYSGYDGSLRSVSTIAHEGGHAIHRELMNVGGKPIYERSGPSYMFEGYAIFNELLVLDHATAVARTPAEKAYALERLLAKLTVELFVSAEEMGFERSLYTEAVGKPLLDRAKIDALYQASIAPYEFWPMSDVGQSRGWMRKALLFEDPLYLVNYLYASVIAVALYEKSHSDPNFAAKYEVLLRRGFDADPQLLLGTIGIRLDDADLIQPATHLLTVKTRELEEAYTAEDRR